MDYADTIKKNCIGVNLSKTCFCSFLPIQRFIGSDFTMFKLIRMFQLPKIS